MVELKRSIEFLSPSFAFEGKISRVQNRLERIWLLALLIVLASYFMMGRTAAYFFVGELELLAALLIYLRGRSPLKAFRGATLVLLGCFMALGFAETVPYISEYKIDALHDALTWGYGIFALVVGTFTKEEDISSFFGQFQRFVHWGVPIAFVTTMITRVRGEHLPHLPWAPTIPIPNVKVGDCGVYISGVIAMLLLFPQRRGSVHFSPLKKGVFYVFLILMILLCAVSARSSLLGVLIPIVVCVVFRPSAAITRVAVGGTICIILGGAVLASGVFESNDFQGRSFSANQIEENALSLVSSGSTNSDLEGTKQWRLNWWKSIADATIYGPKFWTGYGFGVNLSLLAGAPEQDSDSSSLRSPHNGTVDILARMGVPGLILWITLLSTFVVRILRAQYLAYRMGAQFWANVFLWIFCVWLASFTESLSDVYLEGPMGGIFFWSVVGFGEASMRIFAQWRRKNMVAGTMFAEHEVSVLQST